MNNKKEKKREDLNEIILKDKKSKKLAQKIFFSRTVITFLAVAIQLALLIYFIIELYNKIEIYLGFSIAISAAFMIYLSNSKGKNEYKIAWLGLVVIFPIIGITCYSIYHTDAAAFKLRKEIKKINTDVNKILSETESQPVPQNSEFKNLARYLYSQGNFAPYTNTEVKYFPNGETFYPDFLENLKKAKHYIFIEFFIITVDECWEKVVEILEQKVQEGVEVRVICDGVGTYMITGRSYQKYLKSLGIKSKVFNPLLPIISTPINNRDHRKIVVIDGEVGYTGGINLSNQYFNYGVNKFSYWKDNAIRIEGPANKTLLQLFLEVWNIGEKQKDDYGHFLKQDFKQLSPDGYVIPYGDDAFNDQDIAENVYLDLINNAKEYLYITTPYVVIDNQLLTALIMASKKGVDVRVVVPSRPDHLVTYCIGKTYLKDLVDGGVKVYLYERGFIHAKTFISDDKVATVGSVNLDYRSFYAHFECGALLCSCSAIKDIKADFNSIFEQDSKEMKSEDYKKIPAYQRMIGRGLKIFGPLA